MLHLGNGGGGGRVDLLDGSGGGRGRDDLSGGGDGGSNGGAAAAAPAGCKGVFGTGEGQAGLRSGSPSFLPVVAATTLEGKGCNENMLFNTT